MAEDVEQAVEVGAQLGRLAPALAHDAHGLGRRRAHRHRRPDQRRRTHHLLYYLWKLHVATHQHGYYKSVKKNEINSKRKIYNL